MTTTKTRAPFVPLAPEVDDDRLERLAAEKGVGALVKPVANGAGGEAARSCSRCHTPQRDEEPQP